MSRLTDPEQFDEYARRWIDYCKQPEVRDSPRALTLIRSNYYYKRIAALGIDAFPFIRNLYDASIGSYEETAFIKGQGLVALVEDIVGTYSKDPASRISFRIPEMMKGNPSQSEEYTKKWLDENMHILCGHTI